MGLELFSNRWRAWCVSKDRSLSPAIVSSNDWITLLRVCIFIQFLGKLIHPKPGFNELTVKVYVSVFVCSEPAKCCRVIKAKVISAKAIPVRRNRERLDKVDVTAYLLKELTRKNIPITVSICLP